ncbi:MAG: peptidylprolyl isomerase [Alphaproteobacteria bacterium]|nr:peptidylprolyl isomerase [Alphaproteobacteria bacterium]
MKNNYLALALVSAAVLSSNAYAEGKNGVAAVVNGEEITVAEVKKGYDENPQIKAKVPFDEFYGKALDIYVNGKLIYQAAVEDGIMDTQAYKDQLKTAQEDVARKVYLEKRVKAEITDADINKAYNEYKSKFKPQKEVKARHILVSSEAQAKDIIAQLKKGAKFNDLGKKYSKDNSVDLGYFTKEMMVPEFGNAAFAMKKGQISKTPVKTQFGYHIIAVDDTRTTKPLPLKEVKPQIEAMLSQQAVAKVFKDLNENGKVERYSLDGKALPNMPAAQ